MRLSHPDYSKLIFEAYKKQRASNKLSPLLAQSTPGNVRRECANVYQERYEKKDEPVLRAFFGPGEQGRRFLGIIEGFNVNRFKSLDKFLKQSGKEKLSDINLELLAWLIDFRHRPYTFDNNITLNDEESSLINNGEDILENEVSGTITEINDLSEQESESPNTELKSIEEFAGNKAVPTALLNSVSKKNKAINIPLKVIILFCILLVSAVAVFIWNSEKGKSVIMGNSNTSCMYWAYDHYEQVPCNEDRKGRLFLPLETEKIKTFRMITRKDTITEWSIEKIYYIKDNNKIKYYTEPGIFPEDPKRTLKKLSRYIFEKDSANRKIPD